MKWYKHFTDMHRGRSINDLMDQLGHTGLCFYILQEMCAEKLDQKGEVSLSKTDCKFSFHGRMVRQNLRISAANMARLLDICAANGLLSWKFVGSSVEIEMPILLELLDRNTKNAQSRRQAAATNGHLDIERDKEEDKEYIKRPAKISFENQIHEIYIKQYPLHKGGTLGVKRLLPLVKNETDLKDLESAVARYAESVKSTEPKFIKHFSSFANEWRDWLNPLAGQKNVKAKPVGPSKAQSEHYADIQKAKENSTEVSAEMKELLQKLKAGRLLTNKDAT